MADNLNITMDDLNLDIPVQNIPPQLLIKETLKTEQMLDNIQEVLEPALHIITQSQEEIIEMHRYIRQLPEVVVRVPDDLWYASEIVQVRPHIPFVVPRDVSDLIRTRIVNHAQYLGRILRLQP